LLNARPRRSSPGSSTADSWPQWRQFTNTCRVWCVVPVGIHGKTISCSPAAFPGNLRAAPSTSSRIPQALLWRTMASSARWSRGAGITARPQDSRSAAARDPPEAGALRRALPGPKCPSTLAPVRPSWAVSPLLTPLRQWVLQALPAHQAFEATRTDRRAQDQWLFRSMPQRARARCSDSRIWLPQDRPRPPNWRCKCLEMPLFPMRRRWQGSTQLSFTDRMCNADLACTAHCKHQMPCSLPL
jgi:hypothetical protein